MEKEIGVTLERRDGFEFTVAFDGTELSAVVMDEPEPLGQGHGPNAARLLAAAVGHCLSASLLFCLQKSRVEIDRVRTTVRGTLSRNERGRLRVTGLQVRIEPTTADPERMERCLELFEDFCLVTESVRKGIPVSVAVEPQQAVAT